jgi:hypothetical protein
MLSRLCRKLLVTYARITKKIKQMTIQKFEDIIAWQKAQDLTIEIYLILIILTILVLKIKYKEQLFRFQIILQKVSIE